MVPCSPNCAKCSNGTVSGCSACSATYTMLPAGAGCGCNSTSFLNAATNLCVAKITCPLGTVNDGLNNCLKCATNCTSCVGSTTNCSACVATYT